MVILNPVKLTMTNHHSYRNKDGIETTFHISHAEPPSELSPKQLGAGGKEPKGWNLCLHFTVGRQFFFLLGKETGGTRGM